MRTEKEIIDMFVRVATCSAIDDEPCPFIDTCTCDEEGCREKWELWLSHRRRNSTYGQE